jgi:hypothetical protein
MSRRPELYQWTQELARHFPGLPPVLVSLLALWSLGMLLARCCGLSAVACHLGELLDQDSNTTRQHLRELYQEAAAKAGAKRGCQRSCLEVTACFEPLLRWVLSFWSCPRLALALDATNLGDRFHVLCVSVLYGGIGLPVAWKILPAHQKEAWHPHWCALLEGLRPAVPAGWTVVVLTDRGLESARLFRAIVGVQWHPLMRVKAAGKFQPDGWSHWYNFGHLVPRVGARFAATGRAYKSAQEQLPCTLLGIWQAGHEEAWLLLTDLPVGAASPCWYAFRAWIEQGFKVIKSGALQWQHTRMHKAERAERLWLALAVTLLWLVVIGAVVEGDPRKETLGKTRTHGAAERKRKARRRHRLFVVGLARWLAAQLRGEALPQGRLAPEPWPDVWENVATPTEQEFAEQVQCVLPL